MTAKTTGKMPLQASISQLYGYIYCMILSNMLTDMPLYGGVLYLCGKAVIIFTGTVGKNRKFLPAYAKRWVILLLVVLLFVGLLLVGLFPAGIQNEKIWILYAAVALCIFAESNIGGCAGNIVILWNLFTEDKLRGLFKLSLAGENLIHLFKKIVVHLVLIKIVHVNLSILSTFLQNRVHK